MMHQSLSEQEILRALVHDRSSMAKLLHFGLATAFPHPEHPFAQDIWIAVNLDRKYLGLRSNAKPGDIDILVVPQSPSSLLLHKTIAIEVKIVRPTIGKPGRNANSLGVTQVAGLLCDGFPFVGLLHIVLPETLPEHLHIHIPEMSNRLGPAGEIVKTGRSRPFDLFPMIAAERQHGRLDSLALPVPTAYTSIGVTLTSDGTQIAGNTCGDFHLGTANPMTSDTLVHSVETLLHARPDLFHRVTWYDAGG